MSVELSTAPTTDHTAPSAGHAGPDRPLVITRRRIDRIMIGFGALAAVVFAVAGSLLLWGANFADGYVHDELTAQNITFPSEEALLDEGRDDLVRYAGEPLETGQQAEAYASYINGHLENTGARYAEDGGEPFTYAELGGLERAARAAAADAVEAGASDDEIAALQEEAAQITSDRDSLFRGETLRGLLLSAYAWSSVGQIAFWSAIGAFGAAGLMTILVVLGVVHYRRSLHDAA